MDQRGPSIGDPTDHALSPQRTQARARDISRWFWNQRPRSPEHSALTGDQGCSPLDLRWTAQIQRGKHSKPTGAPGIHRWIRHGRLRSRPSWRVLVSSDKTTAAVSRTPPATRTSPVPTNTQNGTAILMRTHEYHSHQLRRPRTPASRRWAAARSRPRRQQQIAQLRFT